MDSYRKAFLALAGGAAASLLFSCASIGNPSGGPRDEDAPVFVRANPAPGATNVTNRRAMLEFDELVNVKDAFSKVVISPTTAQTPRVSTSGRRVYIDFGDSLAENTTYTVDFGNSIEDFTEGNKLPSFAYSFSTGPELDTLQISGMVLAARNLEPQQQMIVGVHSILADSAFKKLRLERVAKTDDRGRFTVRGLKPGQYRLFALADANNDYRWDNPEEDIAFTDFTIEPYAETITVSDTIFDLRTGRVDTIVERLRSRFLPNNILLNSFNVDFKQQYLLKNERMDSTRISLIFNTKADTLPRISLIGQPGITDWYTLERSAHNDTLTYWIRPADLVHTDTLNVALQYTATDKDLNLVTKTDTISFVTPRPRGKQKQQNRSKKSKKDSIPEVVFLDMKLASAASQNIYEPVVIEFGQPLERLDTLAFHLSQQVDTIWKPVAKPYRLVPADSLSKRKFKIEYPWEYGGKYKLNVDTLAATGIYGNFTKPLEQPINVKDRDQYFDLRFHIRSLPDTLPAFVELLDTRDEPLFKARVENGEVFFKDIPLGTYYARLVEDRNGNGEYDTGNYDEQLQPEYVYYFPQALKIKKRWEVDQEWNLTAMPLDLQKPAAIKKNKPEQDKRSRQKNGNSDENEEEDDGVFDPTRNPFDPNSKPRRNSTYGSY